MGIIQARNRGANVINLSLGSPADSPVLYDVISAVARQGIPIFAAAGNEAHHHAVLPAAYPGVIAVTALDHGQIASYANRGSFVSVAALVPASSISIINHGLWWALLPRPLTPPVWLQAAWKTTGSSPQAVQDFIRQTMGFGGK
jgi:subtilisin family serine protease